MRGVRSPQLTPNHPPGTMLRQCEPLEVLRRRNNGNLWLGWAQIDRGGISSWIGGRGAADQPGAAARNPDGPRPRGMAALDVKADNPSANLPPLCQCLIPS